MIGGGSVITLRIVRGTHRGKQMRKKDLICGACQSTDIIKASHAFEAGTQNIRSGGVGIGTGAGGLGVGLASLGAR